MRGDSLDFVFLTDFPGRPALPAPGIGHVVSRLVAPLRPVHWGQVSFRPAGGSERPWAGVIVLAGVPRARGPGSPGPAGQVGGPSATPPLTTARLVDRCLRRTRAARRAGARVLGLGGPLAGNGPLAGGLARETGLLTLLGVALEGAALADASLVVLRWVGVDPARARVVVLVDPEDPAHGEAIADYLSDRLGLVGVWGLNGARYQALAARIKAETGAALEIYRSAEKCLQAADLLVVTGRLPDQRLPWGRPDGLVNPRAVVIADLRAFPGGRVPDRSGSVVRLAGPAGVPARAPRQGVVGRFGPPVRPGSVGLLGPAAAPVFLGGVLFQAPPGWTGRREPGLESGYLSASLAEAAVAAALGRPLRLRVPHPRRQVSAQVMAWFRSQAAGLGLRPAAVAATFGRWPSGDGAAGRSSFS